MEKSKTDAVQMENNNKDTPLHYAFIRNKHKEVPEFVATKYPDFLKKPRSSDGQLPLHVACVSCLSIIGAQVLLEHYPDATKQKDTQGKLPLTLACKNKYLKQEKVLELIELLVRVYPEAVDVEDNDGNQAIDLATHRRLVKNILKK